MNEGYFHRRFHVFSVIAGFSFAKVHILAVMQIRMTIETAKIPEASSCNHFIPHSKRGARAKQTQACAKKRSLRGKHKKRFVKAFIF